VRSPPVRVLEPLSDPVPPSTVRRGCGRHARRPAGDAETSHRPSHLRRCLHRRCTVQCSHDLRCAEQCLSSDWHCEAQPTPPRLIGTIPGPTWSVHEAQKSAHPQAMDYTSGSKQ
jgi:hypothetical protein